MSIGQLDKRVSILQPVVARDADYGSPVTTWVKLDEVWAKLTERGQAESTDGVERVTARQCHVRIRYRSDVLPTMRLQFGPRVLEITGLVEVDRRRWIDIACTDYQP